MLPRQYRPPRRSRGPGTVPGRSDDAIGRLLGYLRPSNLRLIAVAILAILGLFGLLPPGEIRGPAETIDGDTIMVHGEDRVRLYGIDAPELDQPCHNGAACGRRAESHLAGLIGGRMLSCDKRGTDQYGRDVAQCFIASKDDEGNTVRGTDIGRAMVRDGHAMAYRDITSLYVPDEPDHFDFSPPWDWRERQGAHQTR